MIFLLLVADEIQDSSTKEKVKRHITNYSNTQTFPLMSSLPEEARATLVSLMSDYMEYKSSYAKNMIFNPNASNHSKYLCMMRWINFEGWPLHIWRSVSSGKHSKQIQAIQPFQGVFEGGF